MSSEDTEPLLCTDRRELAEDAQRGRHQRARLAAQGFLTSKIAHYSILLMVSLDVSCIFGDIFISLFTCGRNNPDPAWGVVREALGYTSLVFSILFMLELLAAVWAFGFL